MEWWQIVLLILGSIITGILAGALVTYLTGRFVKKPLAIPLAGAKIEEELETKAIARREDEETKAIAKREAEEAGRTKEAEIEEQLKLPAAALLAEVKNNRRIATEPLTDKLIPFQTDIWDAHQYEANKLPAELRENLEQVYTDIRLANSIVWVSTEFNRRSRSLDEHYQRLYTSIAERLDKIEPFL